MVAAPSGIEAVGGGRGSGRGVALSGALALILWLLLVAGLLLAASLVPARAQDGRQGQLDSWNAELSRIDSAIRQVHVTDAELRQFSDQVANVMADASELAARLAPDIAAANAQVKALSPVKGADQTISDDLKSELADAQATQGNLLGTQQRALAIVAHGTATQTQINDRRRDIFTSRLLDRGLSVLDPRLWIEAASEAPSFVVGIQSVATEWLTAFSDSNRSAALVSFVIIAAVLIALIPGRQLLIRYLRRRELPPGAAYSSRSKVVTATLTVAINAVVPGSVLFAGHSILSAFRLTPERVSIVWHGIASATALYLLGIAIARALLAPVRPELRLVNIEDARAKRIFNLVVAIAALQGIAIFIDRLSQALSTALPIVVAINGVLTIASAALIIRTVRIVNRRPSGGDDEDDESRESPLQRLALIVAGLTAALAIAACLLGFVALGRFVTSQVA